MQWESLHTYDQRTNKALGHVSIGLHQYCSLREGATKFPVRLLGHCVDSYAPPRVKRSPRCKLIFGP